MSTLSATITELLAQPTGEAQTQILQQANLWRPQGMAQLLGEAGQRIHSDPPQAQRLLDLCIELTPQVAPQLLPQAIYLRAQIFTLSGDFEQALTYIAQARATYADTGQQTAALRTNVGLLSILIHLGRYAEALDVAAAALSAISQAADLPEETATLLTALIQGNRGNCHKFMGRYEEAIAAYQAAQNGFRALGQEEDVAHIQMNLGVLWAELGHGNEAQAAYEAAADTYARTGNRLQQAQNLENQGELYLWLGNYSRSLDAFAGARDLFAAIDAPLELWILERLTADTYLALNLLPEATDAYQKAIDGLTAAHVPYHLGLAQWGLGATWLRRGRLAEAGASLAQAAALFTDAGNDHLLSGVLLEQAGLAAAQGDRETALAHAREALARIGEQAWPVSRIYAHLRLADLLLPDLSAAEPLLHEAHQLAATLPLPSLRAQTQQRLGQLYLRQGKEREAEEMLSAAVSEVERLRGTLARQSLRASFLQDKTAVYTDLVQLYLSRGDPASLQQAFQVAEQARSRALVDLLSGAVDSQPRESVDPALVARLQSLQADLHAIYNEALRDSSEGDRSLRLAALNGRADSLEQAISRLRLQAERGTPLELMTQPLAALPRMPAPGQTLLVYYFLGEELLAFVYREGDLQVVRQISTLSTLRRHLAEMEMELQRFRADPAFIRRHLPQLTRSTQDVMQALHRDLIDPLLGLLAESERLVIIPHGLLHHLPFAALYDGQRYLVDQFELMVAPSATVLNMCQERAPRQDGQAFVFGVDDPLIPFALQEAAAVSHYLPGARLRLGEQATLDAFQRETTDCSLLHLACHGLFRQDNPLFSGLKLHDGWLTAADALRLRLPGAFVTLSACESGRSEVVGGDELLGLTYAFLGAGATGLLVSLWLVEDETTAMLMTHFYRQLGQGASHPAALRHAQCSLRQEYPHPYYWANFVLIG